ncbi:MAG: nitrilase family protein [Fluviicola sp. XM-24bin1]|nr:MAG: nitrilase family protein [Fluviicola sp. XM-24bin1]
MQDLRVTLVQANQVWEDPSANFENYTKLLEGVETDLILLPEMFHTCFSMNLALADPYDGNATVQWLKDLSKAKDSAIYTSLMVKDSDRYFNRGVFITPSGDISTYDKRKTFGMAKEDENFASGQDATIVSYKDWNFNLQICYDLRFPEIARNKISNQSPMYDVLLYVANWPQKRSVHWKSLLRARAIENQCFVVGVNRVGTDGNGFEYSGDSRLIDALGQEHLLEQGKEMTQTFVMKKGELEVIREKLPFLKDA